jgi:hypothetical protein
MEKTYTQKEVEELANILKERQETLEALECARIVMTETHQYPRFINRINHIMRSIEGAPEEVIEQPVKEIVEKPKNVVVESKNKK